MSARLLSAKTFLFNAIKRDLDLAQKTYEVLAARKTYWIIARARKNKRTARMLASARKDHSILLPLGGAVALQCLRLFCQFISCKFSPSFKIDYSSFRKL